MVAKAENGHFNIQELFKFNFIATYNIRSPEKDSEKKMVLCKKGDDITPFDGSLMRIWDGNVGSATCIAVSIVL